MIARYAFLMLAALMLVPPATSEPGDPAKPALAPYTARELAAGVHFLGVPEDFLGPAIGNVTIIEQRDGMVLIDSGGAIGDGRRVVAYVRALTPKPVKAVVITHWHSDHPAGMAAIRAAWPRSHVIATAKTRANLIDPGNKEWKTYPYPPYETRYANQVAQTHAALQGLLAAPGIDSARRARIEQGLRNATARWGDLAGTHYVLPDRTFTERLLLDDPERPVELMYLGRANTDGDAVAWLPRERIVVTGDIVVAPTPYGFYSYPGDWLEAIARIKALGFAQLVPGHGDPQRDTTYLDRLVGTLTDVRKQVGALAAQGLTLEEVRKRVDFATQTAIFGTTPRLKALFEGYWLEPIIASAYREAKDLPTIQGADM